MAQGTERSRAIRDLLAAHRELSTLEWLEFKKSMVAALIWLACAALFGLAGWLALNVTVVFLLRTEPLHAVAAVALGNLTIAAVGVWRANSLVNRPFFALTKRELAADATTIWKVLP